MINDSIKSSNFYKNVTIKMINYRKKAQYTEQGDKNNYGILI